MGEGTGARPWRKDRPSQRSGYSSRCEECRKYSRRTFYCAKLLKVLDKDREACPSFVPRRITRENKTRKRYTN